MTRRGTSMVIAGLLALAMLLPAAVSSAQAPLVSYITGGKLKAAKRLSYQFTCSANCSVVASTTLKVPGATIPTVEGPAQFAAGTPIEAFIVLKSKRAVSYLKANAGRSKLVTSVSATDLTTGAQQTIRRTYRIKR